jgi:hypothetical protein
LDATGGAIREQTPKQVLKDSVRHSGAINYRHIRTSPFAR